MNDITHHIRALCPYPTISKDGNLFSGHQISHPKKCTKCTTRCCKSLGEDSQIPLSHFICENGLSVFAIQSDGIRLIVNGVLENQLNEICPKPTRKSLRSNKIRLEDMQRWLDSLSSIRSTITQLIEHQVEQTIASLHDVRTAVNLVYRNAESTISCYPGETFDEKVQGAPNHLKDLLLSVGMLATRFAASSIVANPQAVRMGAKRRGPVYKIFHKMVRLFFAIANRRNVYINLSGSSFNQPFVYDSIEVLALVLIDNAVKYSVQGRQVNVKINDDGNGVYVVIESVGPGVKESEQDLIFTKRYRTAEAKAYSSDGAGLGLYIASLIAEAHDTKIWYKYTPNGGGDTGVNCFSLKIH